MIFWFVMWLKFVCGFVSWFWMEMFVQDLRSFRNKDICYWLFLRSYEDFIFIIVLYFNYFIFMSSHYLDFLYICPLFIFVNKFSLKTNHLSSNYYNYFNMLLTFSHSYHNFSIFHILYLTINYQNTTNSVFNIGLIWYIDS